MTTPSRTLEDLRVRTAELQTGGDQSYRAKLESQGKLFVRKRVELLLDGEPEWEDGLFANCVNPGFAADGIITVMGKVEGRPVMVVASDPSVKAGSWGAKTVTKILRAQDDALKFRVPIVYMIDSAGGRLTEQLNMFPGRLHGGRIFHNEIQMSGLIPQICILFGPSPAGAAYLPAFSDMVIMVDGHASAYLGSPRMSEMALGEKVTLEEMGGARMHCSVSGLGDFLAKDEPAAISQARRLLSYLPAWWEEPAPVGIAAPPQGKRPLAEIVPESQNVAFNMYEFIDGLIDGGSFCEYKKLFAPELICGLARLDGRPVGIVANQSRVKGGVLFSDSSDKGARFINFCNAFNIALIFLADVPGFMIGSAVERTGIIRHGAKMIAAVSTATVPKVCVVVRKCYGAGLYAMCGPAYEPDAVIALPTAQIAVMGPEAAINAVYYNEIMAREGDERTAFVSARRAEFQQDIDIYRLASDLVVDAVVEPENLRDELRSRLAMASRRRTTLAPRRSYDFPV